jgi:hypothetical protein
MIIDNEKAKVGAREWFFLLEYDVIRPESAGC